jgi:protein-tyrosine phosphatase
MERVLNIKSGSNVRDVGGYETVCGRKVRWRKIFRSASLTNLTPEDQAQFRDMGVMTICDLRSAEEREVAPSVDLHDGVDWIFTDYPASILFQRTGSGEVDITTAAGRGLYASFPEILKDHVRRTFAAMLAERGGVVVHCMAGQDRTGVVIGVILEALGVPRDTIYEDFHLTTKHRTPENELRLDLIEKLAATNIAAERIKRRIAQEGFIVRPLVNALGQPHLAVAFEAIEEDYGGVGGYLDALGFDAHARETLKDLYLAR